MNKIEIDLDINNYELEDILNLFQLQSNFNEADLKRAKQKVLKLHPDKSRLSSEYFLFYSKAYKVVYSIFEFNNKSSNKTLNTDEYIPLDTSEENKKLALNHFFEKNKKLKDTTNFNHWFNEQFEKNKITTASDESGYGDWLRSEEDVDEGKVLSSMSAMSEEFDKKKAQVRSMVVHKGVNDMYFNHSVNASALTGETPDNYSSGLFSSVPFQDLRQAHVESVIPVTNDDYNSVPKFKNINDYVSFRNTQDTAPLSERQSIEYLNKRNNLEDSASSKRAYELAKQSELAKEKNKSFWGGIMKISNK
jgi:hypothetical protein